METQTRFLIVGSGRSGSSLISAILHDAGAGFYLPGVADWDPVKGAYEHPALHRAYHWQSRAEKIAQSMWPDRLGRRACERRADGHLASLLPHATYLKSTTLVWLVQRIYRLGYRPAIIVSFRTFAEYCSSRFLKFGWSMPRLTSTYVDTYATALLQLGIFGGCALDHRDVVSPEETSWAEALAELTGLEAGALLKKRGERVKAIEREWPQELVPAIDPAVNEIDERLRALRSRVIRSAYL